MQTCFSSLDLFSCLGCHAIGFHRAGIRTIAFCESNEFRRAKIAERFADIPIYDDVRTMDVRGIEADIVVGGPPCQKTSIAAAIHGYRNGESLWPDMLRIGIDVAPKWIVVEQPPGHAAWEAQAGHDLSGAGYHVGRFEFGACDIGAPYLRRRVFLVACTDLSRLALARESLPSAIESVKRAAHARSDWDSDQLAALRVDARSAPPDPMRQQYIEALGDSNPPHMAEVVGRVIVAAEQGEPVASSARPPREHRFGGQALRPAQFDN